MKEVVMQKNGLLKIKFNNESKCENIVDTIKESFKKFQSDKILIETSTECKCGESLILDQLDVGKELAEYFYAKGVQISVYGNCQMFTDFTENVARNRGLSIKVSKDYATLKSWLMAN